MGYMVLDRVHNEWPLNMSACQTSIPLLHRFIWVRWKQTTSSGCVTSGVADCGVRAEKWAGGSCGIKYSDQSQNTPKRAVYKGNGWQEQIIHSQPGGMGCVLKERKKGLWCLHWCSANLTHSVCDYREYTAKDFVQLGRPHHPIHPSTVYNRCIQNPSSYTISQTIWRERVCVFEEIYVIVHWR